jgi:hypothetical protein
LAKSVSGRADELSISRVTFFKNCSTQKEKMSRTKVSKRFTNKEVGQRKERPAIVYFWNDWSCVYKLYSYQNRSGQIPSSLSLAFRTSWWRAWDKGWLVVVSLS